MQRRVVIGVPRAAAAVDPPPGAATPGVGFDAGVAIAVGLTVALAMVRWLFVGRPGLELLLLVPFWFVSAPLVLWLCGHGVVYWDKHESAFLAIDAAARPWLAKCLLVVFAVASVVFAAAFLRAMPSGGG